MKKSLENLLFILLLITIIFTIIFSGVVVKEFELGTFISWAETGQVGDFVGGVIGTLVAAIGFILIYLSFVSQTDSQKDQKDQYLKSQIESRFFELIKLHKENVITLTYEDVPNKKVLKSHKLIDFIYNQVLDCYNEIAPFFLDPNQQEIYSKDYFGKAKIFNDKRTLFDITDIAHIDIAYSIVFYGTSKDDIGALVKLFANKYDEVFISNILKFISLKPLKKEHKKHWQRIIKANLSSSTINETIGIYNTKGFLTSLNENDPNYLGAFQSLLKLNSTKSLFRYYGGHQYKLGHYFRHLFQTTKYVNGQTILKYDEKYNYLKTLRAQLSTVEQYLIFLNSLSFMGRAWELEHVKIDVGDTELNNWLITKYNFIKNLPDLYIGGNINVTSYYPDVHFEFENEPLSRAALKKKFN